MWDAIGQPRHTRHTMFHVKPVNKVIHNPVNNLACTFHIVRYPLKRGITILEGIGRVEGKNAIQTVLMRFRGHANKF